MLDSLIQWLPTTRLAFWVTTPFWSWPICESLHFVGLCLLVGCVGTLDLRLLGVAKGLPIGHLHRYVLWGLFGFSLNMTTGLLFFISRPGLYLPNPAFKWKMLFILIGGVNALLFYVSGLGRRVAVLGPGDDAPIGAKMIALVSLTVWVTVMILGRMLPYLG